MMQLSSPVVVVPFEWGCWEEENIMTPMYSNNINISKTKTISDVHLQQSASAAISGGGDHLKKKKLNHNASERYRRKKINNLYSSLRSLLPSSHQLKKSSIPTTVSRVVKYIPELQQEVDTLIQMKQELASKINTRQGEEIKRQGRNQKCVSSTVSANKVGDNDNEVVVQICTIKKVHTTALSQLFFNLQKDGLNVINVSSFESFGGNLFYNIHLQTEGFWKIECDMVTEKVLSFIV